MSADSNLRARGFRLKVLLLYLFVDCSLLSGFYLVHLLYLEPISYAFETDHN